MPIQKCSDKGKSGLKWGSSGKCYTAKNAREKALKQMRAIEASKSRSNK